MLVCHLFRHLAAKGNGIFVGLAFEEPLEQRQPPHSFSVFLIFAISIYYFTINSSKCHRFYQDSAA
jgi:hypothetical protein